MRPPTNREFQPNVPARFRRLGCAGLGVIGLLFVLAIAAVSGWHTVDTGKVGVTRTFGEITGTRLAGGFWQNPIGFSMVEYDLRVAKTLEKQQAALKNQQTLFVNRIAYQYNLSPAAARHLLETVGEQSLFEQNVVIPKLENAVKRVTPNYVAEQVFPQRGKMEEEMEANLAADLTEYQIVPGSVDITLADFDFDPGFRQSIDAKAKAEQDKQVELANLDKLRTKNEQETQQALTDAKVAEQKAKGEAAAAKARAQGEADAIRLQAAAQSEANQKLAASLTDKLISYQYAQNWNGQLPTTQFGNGGATPLITLPGATPAPTTNGGTTNPAPPTTNNPQPSAP